MTVRLTSTEIYYNDAARGIVRQRTTARIVVIGIFNISPTPNLQFTSSFPFDTGIPVTPQARKNLRLGFQRIGGGLTAVNNAAINNTVYWGFTLGNYDYGHQLKHTWVNNVNTNSRILLQFYFRSESVVASTVSYNVKLYTYGSEY
jgi:hypothetical protein